MVINVSNIDDVNANETGINTTSGSQGPKQIGTDHKNPYKPDGETQENGKNDDVSSRPDYVETAPLLLQPVEEGVCKSW